MYRETRTALQLSDRLLDRLRDALVADNTRDITQHVTEAQAVIDEMIRALKAIVNTGRSLDEIENAAPRVDLRFLNAALASLNLAWNDVERVAVGSSAGEMRGLAADVKTCADAAIAYLRAALGAEIA